MSYFLEKFAAEAANDGILDAIKRKAKGLGHTIRYGQPINAIMTSRPVQHIWRNKGKYGLGLAGLGALAGGKYLYDRRRRAAELQDIDAEY